MKDHRMRAILLFTFGHRALLPISKYPDVLRNDCDVGAAWSNPFIHNFHSNCEVGLDLIERDISSKYLGEPLRSVTE